jgi:P27 family predicted phage terminase small subunit
MRGRKPKTPAEHLRNGNPSGLTREELDARRPIPVAGAPVVPPRAPAYLKGYARKAYEIFIEDLAESGILDRADRTVVIAAALHVGRAVELGEIVNRYGVVYEKVTIVWSERLQRETESTELRSNPAVKEERSSWEAFRHLADHLGLSPVARTRLGSAGEQGRSLETLLKTDGVPDGGSAMEYDNVVQFGQRQGGTA